VAAGHDDRGRRGRDHGCVGRATCSRAAGCLGRLTQAALWGVNGHACRLDGLSRRHRFTQDEDLVFCNDLGEHLDDSALRRRFYAARDRAGLKQIRFHDLRHTFGTLAVQVFPLSDVKAYMGHADIATTMIYVHHVPQIDAAERLSTALRVAAGPLATDEAEGSNAGGNSR